LEWLNKNAANGERPRFYLWTFAEDGRTVLADQEFETSESSSSGHTLVAQIDDVTYVLGVTRYVIMDISYQPGLWALWIGGILVASGLLLGLVPRRQTWAVIAAHSDGHEVRIRDQSRMPIWRRWRRREKSYAQVYARALGARIIE
jgi:hypothetical protein